MAAAAAGGLQINALTEMATGGDDDSRLADDDEGPSSLTADCSDANGERGRHHGHFFSKKTFHRPTYCHHCTDMLWGLIGQGFMCEGQ